MAYDAKAIANYFLDLAEGSGQTLNPMKIQKLVYFAHGWHLAAYNRPLIDEQVQAWRYGPVIPSLYHEFKQYGSGPITGRATTLECYESGSLRLVTPAVGDEEVMSLLSTVWEVYKNYSAIQLSNLTHEKGSPWDQTFAQSEGRKSVDIPDDLIRRYFDTAVAA